MALSQESHFRADPRDALQGHRVIEHAPQQLACASLVSIGASWAPFSSFQVFAVRLNTCCRARSTQDSVMLTPAWPMCLLQSGKPRRRGA